jgi:site-specific recombinase
LSKAWDLTALLNAADPRAPQALRHTWLVRLLEWLRHAAPPKDGEPLPAEPRTPLAALRLRHLLNVLERHPEHRAHVQGLLHAFWREIDAVALFADFGLAPRMSLRSEVTSRIRQRLLPRSPETSDLAELFPLLFEPTDGAWLDALDAPLRERAAALLAPPPDARDWRRAMLDAVGILVSAVQAAGYAGPLRRRMSPALLEDEPFRQLSGGAEALRAALLAGDDAGALRQAQWLRTLLDACARASDSITEHLEEYGISVDIVFEMDQLRARIHRIELLLECLLARDPGPALLRLLQGLVQVEAEMLSLGRLMARQYSLLARQVAERNAETGGHYITRDRGEYRVMLRRAAGGGAVIAGTTFIKFAVGALGLSLFWNGFWTGANYALSFVFIMLLHWTVATKQPAMTAPAMAATLGELRRARAGAETDAAVESFVDRVAALIRSQAAGIFGNLMVCGPLVLALQLASGKVFGVTPVGPQTAGHVLDSLTLLGPTAFFAAFTGLLLFASSLIAGWVENWFVFQRLDSAIAWNPRIVGALGASRAQRWAAWWRRNISGLAANVSLGMMLGLVPALFAFFGLGMEVRHVTLSTGQLAAAAGALGLDVLRESAFWWCLAGIGVTGVLNLTVSFWLAFKVALRSRGVRVQDRARIARAIRARLRAAPLSFLWPPPDR